MRVHCAGVGSIGSLLAFHLRRSNPAPEYAFTIIDRADKRRTNQDSLDFKAIFVEANGIRRKIGGFDIEIVDRTKDHLQHVSSLQRGKQRPAHLAPLPDFPSISSKPAESLPTIQSLILTTKAGKAKFALQALQPRLNAASTVVLLQNGMGVYDHLVRDVFTDPDTRPNFIIASTTHAAWSKQPYDVVHAGLGAIQFGVVPDPFKRRDYEAGFGLDNANSSSPDNLKTYFPPSMQNPLERRSSENFPQDNDEEVPQLTPSALVDPRTAYISTATTRAHDPKFFSLAETTRALLRCSDLQVSWESMSEMDIVLRRKLAVNACVGPLTALLDCQNGALYGNASAHRIVHAVCVEAAAVFEQQAEEKASSASDTDGGPSATQVARHWATSLSRRALEDQTYAVLRATSRNISSMLNDVRHGKVTEIEYINGYLTRSGRELGVPTPTNDMLSELVRLKRLIPTERSAKDRGVGKKGKIALPNLL